MKTLGIFNGLLLSLLAPAMACHGRDAATPGQSATTEAFVLRVDSVQVSPHRPGTESPWDNVATEPGGDNGGCALLAALTGAVFTPVASAAASFLCRSSSSGQAPDPEEDASLPDLAIEIVAGDMPPYRSGIVANTIHHRFAEGFLVPVAAIPDDGLQFSVIDDDRDGRFELIGTVRLLKSELADASASSTHVLVRHDHAGGLEKLELVVRSYQPDLRPSAVDMAANEGTHVVTEDVLAGEFITLSAAGEYTIGTVYSAKINPRGYPNGPPGYNFQYEPFQSAPHASGLALVGRRERWGVVVAPCARFVAPFGGPLIVGVNDTEPENNQGQLRFDIQRRAPTADEWRRHASFSECTP